MRAKHAVAHSGEADDARGVQIRAEMNFVLPAQRCPRAIGQELNQVMRFAPRSRFILIVKAGADTNITVVFLRYLTCRMIDEPFSPRDCAGVAIARGYASTFRGRHESHAPKARTSQRADPRKSEND